MRWRGKAVGKTNTSFVHTFHPDAVTREFRTDKKEKPLPSLTENVQAAEVIVHLQGHPDRKLIATEK